MCGHEFMFHGRDHLQRHRPRWQCGTCGRVSSVSLDCCTRPDFAQHHSPQLTPLDLLIFPWQGSPATAQTQVAVWHLWACLVCVPRLLYPTRFCTASLSTADAPRSADLSMAGITCNGTDPGGSVAPVGVSRLCPSIAVPDPILHSITLHS